MTRRTDSHDWGVVARSFFWFVQAGVLSGIGALSLGMRGGGVAGLAVALVTAFLSVVLLFRQVNAFVDQKMDGRTGAE
ncbi:hypothetical protein ACFQMA_21780 [Halosimplex aquaticum]|uniref:Uncharacterized protein n=1 Tax=Halosimplex aquaticum TaxID=3026162 RepID=A0ABD5Y527_9EURY|nr:hypothetical protein [Halosimplex aquaticum]